MPGDNDPVVITRDSARRVFAATRKVEAQPDQTGRPAYTHVAPKRTTSIVNKSELTVPQYGIVWLRDPDPNGRTEWHAYRTEYGGITRIAIACNQYAPDEIGIVWNDAHPHPVLCVDYQHIPDRSRIAAHPNSFYATARQDHGQFLAVGHVLAEDQPAGLPAGVGLILATLDNRRPSV